MRSSSFQKEFEDAFAEMEKAKKNKLLIIVEGKKDIMSLQRLGFTNVYEISGPLFSFCERIAAVAPANDSGGVCLLTDFDAKGKELYGHLSRNLSRLGVRIDDSLRNALSRLPVSHIEGLAGFMEKHALKR
ncbi:toprim domain-containing protein [Candidatus Woesearchaeota archaeon]|nr:MAG: toprim domain-containing protein [Candidatus Woesearchaeota archaeon]